MVKWLILEFLFPKYSLCSIENEKLKELSKKYYRPVNYPNVVVPKINSEIWNGIFFHQKNDRFIFKNAIAKY